MKLRSLATIFATTLLTVGCSVDHQVIEQLPSPIVATTTPPPPPAPAPPPVAPPQPEKPQSLALSDATIIVDAGHGGRDPGTKQLSRLPEKAIVLSIAREVAKRLADRGANVITTRDDDRFIELDERAAAADRHRANLLVSIHADSAGNRNASGATLYIARGASPSSQRAARSIQAAMSASGLSVRGIVRAGFRVLVRHSRPAVLIECGFLTNHADAARLNNRAHRKKVAAAIADGIASHITR